MTKKRRTTAPQRKRAPQVVRSTNRRIYDPPRPFLGTFGFPRMIKIGHKYCDAFTITSTSGSTGTWSYSCNGLYDPNVSGGGHQPSYFDVCTTIYNHYTVIASRAKLQVTIKDGTAVSSPMIVSMFINDDSTVSGGYLAGPEQRDSVSTLVQVNGGAPPSVLRLGWSAAKVFGPNPLANDNLQGNVSQNPPEQSMFTVMQGPADSASSVTLQYMIEIEYIAIWDELKDFASN